MFKIYLLVIETTASPERMNHTNHEKKIIEIGFVVVLHKFQPSTKLTKVKLSDRHIGNSFAPQKSYSCLIRNSNARFSFVSKEICIIFSGRFFSLVRQIFISIDLTSFILRR